MSDKKKSPLSGLTVENIVLFLRRRTYLTVAIVSWAAMAILTIVIVIPQINLILDHNNNLSAAQAKLTDLQGKSALLASQKLDTLKSEKAILDEVLPAEKPVIPLISSIESMASESQVNLQSYELSPGSIATAGASTTKSAPVKGLVAGVGSLPLKLEVQGGFAAMNNFFKKLDNLIPLVNVNTIDFTLLSQTAGLSSSDVQYRASVELDSLYALPEGKPPTNPTLTALSAAQNQLMASLSAQVAAQPQTPQSFTPPVATGSAAPRQSVFSY